jgi:membrane dipeptidase
MDAKTLHESLIVIDGHCDTAMAMIGKAYGSAEPEPRNILIHNKAGHIDIPRLKKGGVTCQTMALYVDTELLPHVSSLTYEMIESLEKVWAQTDEFFLAKSAADIEKAKKEGKVASLLAIEGGEAIGTSLATLESYYDRGVRLITLTWSRRNAIGQGVSKEPKLNEPDGLTEFGKKVVKRMEELGMIVDASHLSDKSLDDLLKIAKKPIVATHSNSRKLTPHVRNLTDDQAKAIANTGGIVCLGFPGSFIDSDPEKVSKERWFEHLNHFIKLIGSDHVGLGSDFDGFTPKTGVAFSSPEEMPWITERLLIEGYNEKEIANVMGQSWLRVIREIIG